MKLREIEKAMTKHSCTQHATNGPHTKWTCPCGNHTTAIPRHNNISPGVIRNIGRDLACLPKGWLQ